MSVEGTRPLADCKFLKNCRNDDISDYRSLSTGINGGWIRGGGGGQKSEEEGKRIPALKTGILF